MDDLKVLKEMRADAPEPGAERLRTARSRLTEAAEGRRPPYRLGFRLVMAGALAVAVAFAVVLVRGGGEAPGRLPPAGRLANPAVVLEQAALVAEKRPLGSAPRPDQWQYRKYLTVQSDGKASTFEEWIRYDGTQSAGHGDTGRLEVRHLKPDPGDDDLSPEQYREKLLRLPTNPAKLLAQVQGDRHWIDKPVEDPGGGEDPGARAFRVLSVYLEQQAVMPPKLEAAIYRALAKIPGARVELDVRDAAGRPGVGVYHESGQNPISRDYLVLDPRTYRLLGNRMLHLRDEVLDDEILARAGSAHTTAELASGIVDQPGQTP